MERDYQAEAKHWKDLCIWAYHHSRNALMMPPQRPREAREAREKALCEINKALADAVK